MTAWLAVTLMAPLASFGERAGNVERSSADRPTRSALIGLAGAALGIRRDDRAGQRNLAESFRVATMTLGVGTPMSDFHTYESLPSSSRPAPQTRAGALARKRELNTSITRREYRADVWHEAAFGLQEGARWTLDELRDAFLRPRFTLSLGRKSCPLSAPLDPRIMESETLAHVFADRRAENVWLSAESILRDRRAWRHRQGVMVAERREDLDAGNRPVHRHRRHDEPGDRLTWQFSARDEFVLPVMSREDDA